MVGILSSFSRLIRQPQFYQLLLLSNRHLPSIPIDRSSKMRIIGHRGACGHKAENTLSSFAHALTYPHVSMTELDVQLCATGELVIIHDDDVDRTTNGKGLVAEKTFEELRSLVVEGCEKIPLLSEVIDTIDRKIPINIELKGPNTALPVAGLLRDYFSKGWTAKDFVISSFEHNQVAQFKEQLPEVATSLLFWHNTATEVLNRLEEMQAPMFGIDHKSITQDLLDEAHKRNVTVLVYTINDAEHGKRLQEMGVDGIFTDYPDLFH